jgi:hypothetical protein
MSLFNRFTARRLALAPLVVAGALLLADQAAAQSPPGPVIPIGAKPFERQRIIAEWTRWQAEHQRASTQTRRETHPYIPPGAPVDRTFTWYALPEGYQVIYEGTPSAPRYVTEVAPDGSTRVVRLEGPIVMRPARYVLRQGSK